MNLQRTAPLTDEEIEAEMLGSYLTMRKFRRAVFIDWKNDGITPHKAAASSGGMAMFSRISAPTGVFVATASAKIAGACEYEKWPPEAPPSDGRV